LLLGEGLSGAGLSVGRVAGVALLALGAGGWIGRRDHTRSSAMAALLIYNVLTASYLAYLGVEAGQDGRTVVAGGCDPCRAWPVFCSRLVFATSWIIAEMNCRRLDGLPGGWCRGEVTVGQFYLRPRTRSGGGLFSRRKQFASVGWRTN
jgi:hypothetical protein